MVNIKFLNEDAENLSLPDESIDLIITGPPYFGVDPFRYGGDHKKQINFVQSEKEYVDKLIKVTKEFKRLLKNGGSLFINLNFPICHRYYVDVVEGELLNYKSTFLWDYSEYGHPNNLEIFYQSHQTWLHFYKGHTFYENPIFVKKFPGSVIKTPFNNIHLEKEKMLSEHGFILDAYSIDLAQHFIQTYSPPRSTVLDPFGGSGVAAVTAYLNNRNGVTNDISEDAVELAKKRYEIYTN